MKLSNEHNHHEKWDALSCLIHSSLVLLDVFRGYRKATPGCNGLNAVLFYT